MGNIKGACYVGVCEYLLNFAGPQSLEKVKNALSKNDRKFFLKTILPISWLDYGAYIRFLLAADKTLGNNDLEFVKKAITYEVNKNFTTLYRFLVAVTSVQFLLSKAPRIWRQFFDAGVMKTEGSGKNAVRFEVTDFPDMPVNHEFHYHAVFEELGRFAGAKVIQATHLKCLARGDACCLSECKWE